MNLHRTLGKAVHKRDPYLALFTPSPCPPSALTLSAMLEQVLIGYHLER